MRSYLRERDELVTARSTQPRHLQQALAQMNVPLTQMRSDRNGQSGLASIGAILRGGRNPLALAVAVAQVPD